MQVVLFCLTDGCLLISTCVFVWPIQIKAFGSLVKGLRVGINLLSVLQKKNHEISSLSKIVNLPILSELDELLHQYEVALDDDFPRYQVCYTELYATFFFLLHGIN